MAPADALTAVRLPLAVLFVLMSGALERFAILAVVAVTDVLDGIAARQMGPSKVGAVLDPVVDKLFMAAAFWVVWSSGVLSIWEILAVLLRDIVALLSLITVSVLGKPTTLPARAGGKAVTIAQLLTLVAFIAGSDLVVGLAWATGAISLYAIADYTRVYRRANGVRGETNG